MAVLCEMVLQRFERYFSREKGKFRFSLYKCFEDTGIFIVFGGNE